MLAMADAETIRAMAPGEEALVADIAQQAGSGAGEEPRVRERWPSRGARTAMALGACPIVFGWALWVTMVLADPGRGRDRFVKLQLQNVIAEYLQAQARSGNDDRSAAQATTQFMAALDQAVAEIGKTGRVVIVNEAVIGGDIRDVTAEVKRAVYAKVTMPAGAVKPLVDQDMRARGYGEGRSDAWPK
jgi:hypothetical protein